MKKKASQTPKSVPNRRIPNLFQSHPFTLPGHMVVRKESTSSIELQRNGWQRLFGLNVGPVWPNTEDQLMDLLKAPSPTIQLKEAVRLSTEERFRMYCQPSPQPAGDLIDLAKTARQALGALATAARAGDSKALTLFAQLMIEAGEGLSEMAKASPAALAPIARQESRWPLMTSRHPMNSDPLRLLDDLELSQGLNFVVMDKWAKWKPGGPATNCAFELLKHLLFIQQESPVAFSKILPELSPKTAEQWWSLAQKFLQATYGPRLEEIPELDAIVTAPTKRKSPGRRREAIQSILRDRFLSMVGTKGRNKNGEHC